MIKMRIMKLKYIIIAIATAVFATGCNEETFLDVRPQGTLNEDVLASAEGLDLLVSSAYAALKGPNRDMMWIPMTNWTYGEVRSDNAYKGGGGITDGGDVHKMETFNIDATWGNADGKWYSLYCCLQRSNEALRLMNTLTEEEVANLEVLKAEMKVIRAHFYFELSRLFNMIPYLDETINPDTYTEIPNNGHSRDQILGFIAKDLVDAAEVLPENQAQVGHVNRYVAYAYAAKVKLYQAYVQDENNQVVSVNADLMREVVELCNKLEGKYGLLDDFQQLDLVAYENGKESVFAVQYTMNDGSDGAGGINWSNLLNAPLGPYGGDGFFLPSQNLINAYKTDENGLPLFDTFNDEDYGVYANGELQNIDSNVDPRLDFVTGRPGIRWKTYGVSACKASWVRNQGDYGYNCTKRFYVSPETEDMFVGWPWGASEMNHQIIRYAQVLLWKAEALVELGDGASLEEARQTINLIRRRAKNSEYVKDFENPAVNAANYKIEEYPASGWDQEYARKALRFETRLEMAMEGDRFFDLVRWGIARETMNAFIDKEQDNRVYYKGSNFISGRDEYLPIPLAQYNFSEGRYVQNPGYGAF